MPDEDQLRQVNEDIRLQQVAIEQQEALLRALNMQQELNVQEQLRLIREQAAAAVRNKQ
jgi:hypothetical protein